MDLDKLLGNTPIDDTPTNLLARLVARHRTGGLAERIARDEASGRRWNRGPGWSDRPVATVKMDDRSGVLLTHLSLVVVVLGVGATVNGVREVREGASQGPPLFLLGVVLVVLGIVGIGHFWRRIGEHRDRLIDEGYQLVLHGKYVGKRHRVALPLAALRWGWPSRLLLLAFVILVASVFALADP